MQTPSVDINKFAKDILALVSHLPVFEQYKRLEEEFELTPALRKTEAFKEFERQHYPYLASRLRDAD